MLNLWTIKLPMRLQVLLFMMLKLIHLPSYQQDCQYPSSKPKLQEPDPFDGSDPQKLHTFILQCKLNFWYHPDIFQDDTANVNYILSFLKGIALDCFEPTLLDLNEPAWLLDLCLFIKEIETIFRTYNPVSEAEAELGGLHMQENYQATKYFIKFQQIATHIQWGKAALCRQAYNGIAKHIKDNVVHHDKLNSLFSLQTLFQAIDAWYWEWCGEVSHETCVKDLGFSPNPYSSQFVLSQFIHLNFYSCEHSQLARVCCDCILFSQECDSVTSALFQETEVWVCACFNVSYSS